MPTLIPALATLVVKRINDPHLEMLIGQMQTQPQRVADALECLSGQLSAARLCNIYAGQREQPPASLAACYRASDENPIYLCWTSLVSDAGNLALAIFSILEPLRRSRKSPLRLVIPLRARQAALALRLMLLARWCAVRASVNLSAAREDGVDQSITQPADVLDKFDRALKDYLGQVRAWRLRSYLASGELDTRDEEALHSWESDFGYAEREEFGWSRFAPTFATELRYRRYLVQEHRRWRELLFGHNRPRTLRSLVLGLPLLFIRLLGAVGFYLFGLTTGYGLKPRRFAGAVALTILTFSVLYFADDFVLSQCGGQLNVRSYGQSLYFAVANLTNVGANGICGSHQGVLVSVESLIGYFLLSVLAAMLFAWLTGR